MRVIQNKATRKLKNASPTQVLRSVPGKQLGIGNGCHGAKDRFRAGKKCSWVMEEMVRNSGAKPCKTERVLMGDERISPKKIRLLIESQGYRCALTGRPLTPDVATLDHIVPLARGGEHSISNLQVLHKDANVAKAALDQDDFIRLCRDVVAHADTGSEIGTRHPIPRCSGPVST